LPSSRVSSGCADFRSSASWCVRSASPSPPRRH
jgi:hypothetical protein